MFNWSVVIMNELKGHARKFQVLLSADELIRKEEILEQEEDIWYIAGRAAIKMLNE